MYIVDCHTMTTLVPEASKTTMQGPVIFMIVVFLLKAQGQSTMWRCGYSNTTGVELLQSNDNILGRYNLQICTSKPLTGKCDISILYHIHVLEADCKIGIKKNSFTLFLHSFLECQANLTCENDKSVICYIHPIDLIIKGCYEIEFRPYSEGGYNGTRSMTYIHNNLTQQLVEKNLDVIFVTQGNNILWQSSLIPITTFTAKLCNKTSSSEICTFITNNCTRQQNNVFVVECLISQLTAGYYVVYFTHADVPWTEGHLLSRDLFRVSHFFNISTVKADKEAIDEDSNIWIYYVVCLVTLVVTCIGGGYIYVRCCKRKPKSYPQRDPEDSLLDKSQSNSKCIILVVYASKDSKEGQALSKLFTDNGAVVVDIQSVRAMKAAGEAPSVWATKMIQNDNVKIVWLQTRRTTQDEFNIQPIQTFGDTLVQHFLWRMTDTLQQPKPYNKYFLAAFPGAVEFPNHSYIVRFTRFIITESVKNLLLYTGTISDVKNVHGIDQFYKTIK